MKQKGRLRELDFLRGVAILLVLIRHSGVHALFKNAGWIGVDLFFVLSGFLVSGLLFRELQSSERLSIGRFLIRRGFKIYPLFYITTIPYVLLKFVSGTFSVWPFIGDLVFMQNYVSTWGYLYAPGWSLAVEEHFYLGLVGVLAFTYQSQRFKKSMRDSGNWIDSIVWCLLVVMFLCLAMRLVSNFYWAVPNGKLFSQTHLRIDSLLAGVLLSYFYYFKREKLERLYGQNRKTLLAIALLGVVWTPFINPIPSVFVKTIGFTLLYVSFGILLLTFLLEKEINAKLDKLLTKYAVDFIAYVGFSSYAIYIIHTLVNELGAIACRLVEFELNPYLMLVISSTISILSGTLLTQTVEDFFLKVRNRYFPSKVTMHL